MEGISNSQSPDSLQPIAPQAPGNVLWGRFGTATKSMNWKHWVLIGVVIGVAFYLWKKYRG